MPAAGRYRLAFLKYFVILVNSRLYKCTLKP